MTSLFSSSLSSLISLGRRAMTLNQDTRKNALMMSQSYVDRSAGDGTKKGMFNFFFFFRSFSPSPDVSSVCLLIIKGSFSFKKKIFSRLQAQGYKLRWPLLFHCSHLLSRLYMKRFIFLLSFYFCDTQTCL